MAAITKAGGEEMTLTDATWIFTAIIFAVITVCVVWIMKEERKK
jgi:preprotein translocase subunit SecG